MEATLPRTRCFDVPRPDGQALRLFVAWPATPPPPHGYPVVYVLDGNVHFHVAVQSARALSYRPELTGLDAPVVVGIGYPDVEDYDLRRRSFDYTPEAPVEALGPRPNAEPWPPVGGAERFIAFIEDVVKPRIGAEWPLDPERQSLFGHSFGGLLTLYCAFTRPGLYRSFLASSPSIWFGDKAVLRHEPELAGNLARLATPRDLMITVGDQEQTAHPDQRVTLDPRWLAWLARNRMVDNARELAARLAALDPERLRLSLFVFDDENHITASPLALGKGMRIALSPRDEAASERTRRHA